MDLEESRIAAVVVTPLAFADPPLLNAGGVHEPLVLRAVIEMIVDGPEGEVVGLGECTGHAWQLDYLVLAAAALEGHRVWDVNGMRSIVRAALSGADVDAGPDASWRRWSDRGSADSRGPAPLPAGAFDVQRVFSALEVAAVDVQARLCGIPVVDLIGGAVRERVPYSAYLFYKWAEHPPLDGKPAITDEWGGALDPAGIVDQARLFADRFGFGSFKLKGGVMPVDEEIEAVKALRRAFPDAPLRIDPNAVWTPAEAERAAAALEGTLEYLEDPVAGLEAMAALARRTSTPLATNMVITAVEHVLPAVRAGAMAILLGDHHIFGGIRGSLEIAAIADAVGWGLSMHSNSHLGVSLAAMTAVAAASPKVEHASDTHLPWNRADDIVTEPAAFADGSVTVRRGPGLGVTLDRTTVARLHRQYLDAGREHRNDRAYFDRALSATKG